MKRQGVLQLVQGAVALACVALAWPVHAQTVRPFQMVGHIQNFCLDNQFNSATQACPKDHEPRAPIPPSSPANIMIGAKMVVNGITVTIPNNTVVLMPAAYLTPWQIFDKAQGVSRGNNESGLALQDKTRPLAAFEVAVDGNIVNDVYIAGLVSISQQSLNVSAGFIHTIDTSNTLTGGIMCVGASPTSTTCLPGDTRIRLNDPSLNPPDPSAGDGRYGQRNPDPADMCAPGTPGPTCANNPNSRFPDPRFTVDQGNPTVHALTGYPMCVPRSLNDAKCPAFNRPADNPFVMGPDSLIPPVKFGVITIPACPACNQNQQAPVKVGDYVTFSGTLASDAIGMYVSVHTLVVNVGIYTQSGVDPAYVTLDESLIGTMGPLAMCAGTTAECQDRIKIEGFVTDPTRVDSVHVYALDYFSPGGGFSPIPKVRRLGPAPKDQAVYGRFRFITGKRALVLFDSTGTRGATRELMVRLDGNTPLIDGADVPSAPSPSIANGLTPGIYAAPIGEYIFPEPTGVQGGFLPPLNFECLAFLVKGWSHDPDENIVAQQLAPWPGKSVPTNVVCNQE